MKHKPGSSAGLMLLLAITLNSCGTNYQAPVSDQSERLVITPPIIVNSSTPDSSLRAANYRPTVASASAPRNQVSAPQIPVNSATPTPRTHKVSRGDTLYLIAFQYDLDFRALALANGLNPPYTIFVDQELNLDVTAGSSRNSGISATSSIGVPVANNSVARAQGTNSTPAGVTRQAIGSASVIPSWQWPHNGRVARSFDAQGKGIDFDGHVGEPVYAAGDGDVVYSGRGIQGAGELIILRHSDHYLSTYSHNSTMLVKEGDRVSAGQQIAEVGESPTGTPMLHFEIRVDGKSVDPTALLPRR